MKKIRILFAMLIGLILLTSTIEATNTVDTLSVDSVQMVQQDVANVKGMVETPTTEEKTAADIELAEFFDWSAIPYYFLGLLAFFAILLFDWLNKKEQLHKPSWYVQEFIYTIIAIALGIYACRAIGTSPAIMKLTAIICGLVGTSIIRTFLKRKQSIADSVVDKVEDKISKQ